MTFRDQLALRQVVENDRKRLRDWRNQDFVRAASLNNHVISLEEHNQWFDRVLDRNDGLWCVTELDGQAIGHVNAVVRDRDIYQWSFYIGERDAPKGCGAAMLSCFLKQVFDDLKANGVFAQTVADNAASIHLHQKLGFAKQEAKDDEIISFRLSLQDWKNNQDIYNACLDREIGA